MKTIQCGSIWGGTKSVNEDVKAAGLEASIFSAALRSDSGGDVYYVSVCGGDLLTRVALADVTGHGASVSDVGHWMYDSLSARMDDVEGNQILSDLNDQAVQYGVRAMATAAVIGYYRGDGRLYYSYAGHPPMLIQDGQTGVWSAAELNDDSAELSNLPLAVLEGVRYDLASRTLNPGDRLVLVTDGILEVRDAARVPFGIERLMETLNGLEDADVATIKNTVVDAARRHGGGEFHHDDVTMVAMKVL